MTYGSLTVTTKVVTTAPAVNVAVYVPPGSPAFKWTEKFPVVLPPVTVTVPGVDELTVAPLIEVFVPAVKVQVPALTERTPEGLPEPLDAVKANVDVVVEIR